jgi:anthranilate phosphoribosyltransferase
MISNRSLKVETPDQSREMLLGALNNEPGAPRDIVALNAGAALYAANVASSIADGIRRAQDVLASGAARAKLDEFVRCTQKLAT